MTRYGIIAGSGRFPLLAIETARGLGHEAVVVAIRGEAGPEIAKAAPQCHWITIGELSKLIGIFKQENVTEAMMTGQVKHANIFSSVRPDWRLFKLLASLKQQNTSALIGGVVQVLEDEGIRLVDSTVLLKPLLAGTGVLTKRPPEAEEEKDAAYGRRIANALAHQDVGQSVVISARACVAIEAMEGTDAMLRRAASLVNGNPLRLVKVSRGRKHLLFDVPVAGLDTIAVMRETNATMLAVDAGRTLLLDKDAMIAEANRLGVCIVGYPPVE